VTLIFGEDGKEIPAKPPQEKSVYDLDPEEEDNIASGKTQFFPISSIFTTRE
jgi:hypothetical protein